ncbi:hypothetical protein [Polyangium spumosum]|nr:hypothetical protein [Polyangium spumosum]
MWTSRPTVDHYLSKSSREGRALTYEWSNYRRADLEMNQAKGTWDRRILDPFEVQDDWFEILLPTLELIVVDERIPLHRRDDALFTLRTLGLGDGDDILAARLAWYEPFTEGMVDLQYISKKAPLIARAVRKRLAELNPAAFDDEQTHFRSFLDGDCTLKILRKTAPRLAETIDAALRRPDERAKRR